jgi:lipopolysaccharide/colanic/teichoic acid biosynthesis glycosyltransferase/acetyltransferase-like isoleucine patch superfamily enzyme
MFAVVVHRGLTHWAAKHSSMSVFPILIDSVPPYAGRDSQLSLMQMPIGRGTVLTHLCKRVGVFTRSPALVVRGFDADSRYDDALTRTGAIREPSVSLDQFPLRLCSYEPFDWLLFVDPRCFPLDGLDLSSMFDGFGAAPRLAIHFVALAHGTAGTHERVEFDSSHRVRRVQRYYDALTWTVARGVAASLVPMSALTIPTGVDIGSLVDLRGVLSSRGVPSRDVPITGPVVDLACERALHLANDRLRDANDNDHQPVDASGAVHPTARVIGSVVLQPGSYVAEGATVIGPSVIGEGAHIGRGAVVAQCVVAARTTVDDGVVIRHRVAAGAPLAEAGSSSMSGDDDFSVHLHQDARHRGVYPVLKAVVDATVAAVALILLSPLLLLVAVLVKLDSRGPVLYGDPREARAGKAFRCYKFRTMRVGADAVQRDLAATNEVDGPQFKMKHDPRVTRLGVWLRKTSLDELPQLLNVALGQMSLVGPRPSPFRENQTCVPWREARLSVRPGITGLWQVCRHDRELADFHQWIHYDMEYIRHISLLVDLKILLATIWTCGGRTHVPLSWIISPGANAQL